LYGRTVKSAVDSSGRASITFKRISSSRPIPSLDFIETWPFFRRWRCERSNFMVHFE